METGIFMYTPFFPSLAVPCILSLLVLENNDEKAVLKALNGLK